MSPAAMHFANHLEERLLHQAEARALYTPPPFLGVICLAYPKA